MEKEIKIICQLCKKEYKKYNDLSNHLNKTHTFDSETYYNLYLQKEVNEHICKFCGSKCKFIGLTKGYKATCCSDFCIKQKIKETCIENYGVDNPAKSKEIQLKIQETTFERYGVKHAAQNKDVQEKSKNTCLEKYGVEYSFQSENNKNKSINTCLDKYGVEYYFQTDEFQEKFKNTNLGRYGVEYPLQSEEKQEKFKQTCLDKYGVENPNQANNIKEKKKESCLEKYGVDNYFKSVEFLSKEIKGYSKISQELFWGIYEQLLGNIQKECYFAELNRERFLNYKGQGFMYDFCILSKKIIIEFNGDYWHRNPEFCEATEENIEIWKKDEFKKQIAEEKGFKILYIWENEYNKSKNNVIKYCLNFILIN